MVRTKKRVLGPMKRPLVDPPAAEDVPPASEDVPPAMKRQRPLIDTPSVGNSGGESSENATAGKAAEDVSPSTAEDVPLGSEDQVAAKRVKFVVGTSGETSAEKSSETSVGKSRGKSYGKKSKGKSSEKAGGEVWWQSLGEVC
ncbi:unnamed protein product [Linum trigynum]|uniref:Uncharacterized protein n=1 Tax=Linum trigynum TaxID=586398 RepID=A0AAV2ERU0_9ROSI